MKKKNKWKKLRRKQFVWLSLLIFLWLMCLLIEIVRFFLTKQECIIEEMVTILVIGVPCIVTISLVTRKTRKISSLMEQFITRNGLYQSHYVKKLDGATAETIEKITYYPCVEYKVEKVKNRFLIRILLDGTMLAERFRDLEQALADMFRTICIEKIEERGFLTYCFELKPQKQIRIEKTGDIISAGENEIRFSRDIVWDWIQVPHLLLTGATGSGKTLLAQYIISCMITQGVRVIYCDPKNDDDMRFFLRDKPVYYATEENEIAKVVREVAEEVQLRERNLDNMGLEEAEFNPVFLFFDELIAFSKIANKKTYEETERRIGAIVVSGRSKRIYAGLIMQRADVTFIEGAVRDNLRCKICMGQMSETAYKMSFGSDFSHVRNYRREIGSGLIYRQGVDTKPRELIAPFICEGALSR